MRGAVSEGSVAAQVGAKPGRETVTYNWSGGKTYVDRPTKTNAEIMRIQAKNGRNVVFVSAAERDIALATWRGGLEAALRGDRGAIARAAVAIAEQLVENVRNHILEGKRSRGRVKPLLPNYEKRKRARAQKRGDNLARLRPLIDTGQLFDSFIAGFRRL
jgi:hypothetical protein